MEQISKIIECLQKLKDSPTIIGLLGDKADSILSNEIANVAALLKTPMQGKGAQDLQQKQIGCTPQSWAMVVTQAVQLGVSLNPFQKHAAVVPYGDKATLTIMVAGLKHLLYSNNIILSMSANAVCENDIFEMSQPLLPETILQNFKFQKAKTNRGKVIGAYCFFKLENGQYIGDYLPIEEVKQRRTAAKTAYIWDAWEIEMTEKTAVRYVQKQLPTFTKFESLLNEIETQHFDFEQKALPESHAKALPELSTLDSDLFNNVSMQYATESVTLEQIQKRYKLDPKTIEILNDARANYSA